MPARLIAGAVLLLVSLFTGCARTGGAAQGDQPGCESPAVEELGIPFRGAGTAFFDTTGVTSSSASRTWATRSRAG